MNEERIKELVIKYRAGETSAEEEVLLKHNANGLDKETKDVFKYIAHHTIKPPSNFNEDQWKRFELKRRQRKINRYSIISLAASVVIILGLFLFKPSEKEMDLAEKQAKLNEALELTNTTGQDNKDIILYEDELVIIYTTE